MTPIRLPDEPAFVLGAVTVDPASRTLAKDGRVAVIEPRMMQVLVVLAREPGKVVGRQGLIDSCWDGRIVGDDAINRAILKLRRALDETGGGITVDTVPRVGYRLNCSGAGPAPAAKQASVPRRALIFGGGAVAAAASVAGVGYLAWPRPYQRTAKVAELFDRGRIAFQQGSRNDNAQAIGFFEQATAIAPDDPDVAGALALAYRFEQTFLGPAMIVQSTARADAATARALHLDPRNPDAIAARSMYLPFRNHWSETERRLRAGLREVPDSGVMNGFLAMDLSDVGRTRGAIVRFERGVAGARFVPLLRGYFISALFAAGRIGDADQELEAASALWPRFAELWRLRFWTLAFTGRLDAASAHLAVKAHFPVELDPGEIEAARLAVAALASRSSETIGSALSAWTAIAGQAGGQWRATIGLAAMLGRIDEALAMTERYVAPYTTSPITSVPGTAFLFGAPLAALHSQAAFWTICRNIGLERYWRETGTRPDIAASG